MTDQTTATLPATDQATFSRTGLLFGALCLVALIAPLVHVKPNRILAGEGLALPAAVQRANAVAALSVTNIGAQISFPDRIAADAFIAAHGIR